MICIYLHMNKSRKFNQIKQSNLINELFLFIGEVTGKMHIRGKTISILFTQLNIQKTNHFNIRW